MVPTLELRLQAMHRALTEVIIPALDPSRKLALDQARIVVGNLRLMADQIGHATRYELVELREYAALVSALAAAAQGGDSCAAGIAAAAAVLAEARPVAALPVPSHDRLARLVRELKAAAEALLLAARQDGTASFRAAAAALILAQAEGQITRERVWFRQAGFELEPETLPALDTLLEGEHMS